MAQEETLGSVVPTLIYLHPAWTERGSVSLNHGTSFPFQPAHLHTSEVLHTWNSEVSDHGGGRGEMPGAWNPRWKPAAWGGG